MPSAAEPAGGIVAFGQAVLFQRNTGREGTPRRPAALQRPVKPLTCAAGPVDVQSLNHAGLRRIAPWPSATNRARTRIRVDPRSSAAGPMCSPRIRICTPQDNRFPIQPPRWSIVADNSFGTGDGFLFYDFLDKWEKCEIYKNAFRWGTGSRQRPMLPGHPGGLISRFYSIG